MDVFFWSGRGGEEKAPGHVQQGRFSLDDVRFEQPHFFYVIYYISSSGGVAVIMTPATADGAPDPRCPGQTRVLFKFRQPEYLFHALKTGGLRLLVREGAVAPRSPRTPRSSGYDVYAHVVYVGTQIGMFRPIRMDHTNCLQVAIKTLQFNVI